MELPPSLRLRCGFLIASFALLAGFPGRLFAGEASPDGFEDVSFLGDMGASGFVEAPGDPQRFYLLSSGGNLLRSDDGGRSFSAAGLAALPQGEATAILVHPLDADELYLISSWSSFNQMVVFRSTDGGRSLAPFSVPPGGRSLWIEPRPPYRLFTAKDGRLVVQEAGQPWLELPEIVPGNAEVSVESLAFDPHHPGHLLAAAGDIFESRDDGLTWQSRLAGSFRWLGFDPFFPDQVWALFFNGEGVLWRSIDGGSTWTESPRLSYNDHLRLDFDPYRPGYLLQTFGHRHGLPQTTRLSRDGGATWEPLALPVSGGGYELSALPDGRWVLTSRVPAAASFFESRDAGATWLRRKALPSQVLALAVDPQDPEHAWAADDSGVHRTTRGGASWQPVFSPGVSLRYRSPRLAVDREDNRVVFLAHSRDSAGPCIWRSTDRGRTWYEAVSAAGEMTLTSFEIGRIGELSFVLATFDTSSGPQLWRSTDHGASWQMHSIASAGAMAVDPESGRVYQPSGTELRQSLDGGLSFTAIEDFSGWGARRLRVLAGPGGTLFVLIAKSEFPLAEEELFELLPGQGPARRWLPGTGDGGCSNYAGVLATGVEPGQLYVSQDCDGEGEQLWESGDGGRNWKPIWRGAPKGELRALVAAPDGGSIWLVPAEFGIYRGRLSNEERLFLQRRRFAVTADFRGATGESGSARPFFLTDQTGYFSFGSPAQIDLAVKILDGRPLTGAWWVFAASLDDREFDLEVRDLENGEVRRFHHDAGSFASFADYDALADPAPLEPRSLQASPPPAALAGGRFEVSVDWRDFTGTAFSGHPQPRADDTVVFSFFWQQNVELIVRITDGTAINGHFWVSFAALTNVEYFLSVRDTWTGEVWTRHNPLGSFGSGIDSAAFPAVARGGLR